MPPMALPPLSMFQDNREQTAGLGSPANSESGFSLLLQFIILKELSPLRVQPFVLLRKVCYVGR